jgi:hypothetical protein
LWVLQNNKAGRPTDMRHRKPITFPHTTDDRNLPILHDYYCDSEPPNTAQKVPFNHRHFHAQSHLYTAFSSPGICMRLSCLRFHRFELNSNSSLTDFLMLLCQSLLARTRIHATPRQFTTTRMRSSSLQCPTSKLERIHGTKPHVGLAHERNDIALSNMRCSTNHGTSVRPYAEVLQRTYLRARSS